MPLPFTISFSPAPKFKADTVVAFILKDGRLSQSAEKLDHESGGLIMAHLKRQKTFSGKKGQIATLAAPASQAVTRMILAGIETPVDLTTTEIESIGQKLCAALKASEADTVILNLDGLKAEQAAQMLQGLCLASYSFERYRSKKSEPFPRKIIVTHDKLAKVQTLFKPLQAAVDGVFFARDLVNTPANDLYPESYARLIRSELGPLGIKVTVIDDKQMKKIGFGAHLAVGQGSARPPRVVIMEWNGTGSTKTSKSVPLALVGKGVTFDTGGISIKPAGGMEDMKMDMGGSAAVVGAMMAMALRKSRAHVIGIVGLAENMPSSNAYRPGDIVTSLAGKTIEVLNTDAEGRLVLCDALTYVQDQYKPATIIDLATLTGAIVVALGHEYCGSFVNDDRLWAQIDAAGKAAGEKYWRMPLDETYRKDMESKTADLRNIGPQGKAGSCTAAGFLETFIKDDVKWAHLDIAGTGMTAKGGTGFGVRMLDRLVADQYEKK